MTDLSVLIPSRCEMFLTRTIADILEHAKGDTEVIAVLDGAWAEPPIPDHPKVTLVYHSESIGQRAATNEAAKISRAKYVMKCDAHCAFDDGFDVKLLADMQDDWTVAPLMRNLHAFDWLCEGCNTRIYQGPTPEACPNCGKPMRRDVVWIAKPSPQSTSYCFDPTPHFQYFGDFKKRPEGKGDLTETMSLQGSCFLMTREKYFELGVCDEDFGSWGSQGIEVAVKTWLSGGRVLVNHKTWYAHMFRTQGGDFSFPYPLSGKQVERAKSTARKLFFENNWAGQKRPLSWLVTKFWPVPGWTDEDLEKLKKKDNNVDSTFGREDHLVWPILDHTISANGLGRSGGLASGGSTVQDPMESERLGIANRPDSPVLRTSRGMIFYTDSRLPENIARPVQTNLAKIAKKKGMRIVSASLKKLAFGDKNIHFPSLKPGYVAYFKQIIAALEHSQAEVIYFCEHDCLYPEEHFDFIPARPDRFYYDLSVWKVRLEDGHALHYDACQCLALVCFRDLALGYYRDVLAKVERDGFSYRSISFEPGTRDGRFETFCSARPILDIRHGGNLTKSRWTRDEFRDKSTCQNWQEADSVDGWYAPGKFGELIHA